MKAINYCHSNKICHRDLKPENFLYMTKDEYSPIKVIDFGLSKVFGEDLFEINKTVRQDLKAEGYKVKKEKGRRKGRRPQSMQTRAGTPYYISPEVLAGEYDESCDIWSAGVILYIVLCGYPPFYGNTDFEILSRVNKGEYDFDGDEWTDIHKDAIDLIKNMITSPDKRLTAMQVLAHPWMTKSQDNKKTNLNFAKMGQWHKM